MFTFNQILLRIIILKFLVSIFIWGQEDYLSYKTMSIEELMSVNIVSASKFYESIKETPSTIIVITSEEIFNRGYKSLTEVLYDLPGFDVISAQADINQLVYTRGNRTASFNERILFLIDGIEHNILYTQHTQIDTDFPISAIHRIEVLYGPASAVYGPNAFSSIINIITRQLKKEDKSDSKIYSTVGAGSYNTQFGELTFLGKHKNINVSFSFRGFRSDRHNITNRPGYFSDKIIGNENIWGPYADFYKKYENSSFNHSILAKVKIKDVTFTYNRLQTIQGSGSEYPYDKTIPISNWKFFRNNYNIRYDGDLTEKIKSNFIISYQEDGTGPDSFWPQGWNEGDSWNDKRFIEMLTWKFLSNKWKFTQDLLFKLNENFRIIAGVNYSNATYQKGYEFGRTQPIIFTPGDKEYIYDELFPQAINEFISPGNSFTDTEWGVFSQIKLSMLENKINIVAGARFDDNSIYGSSFNPRLGLIYRVFPKLYIKSNFGTAFQAPSPRNLYGAWGGLTVNPNLNPDKISSMDFSLVYYTTNFSNDLTLYYNIITNSIFQGQNLPDKNMFGLEYNFNYKIFEVNKYLQEFDFHFIYSFTQAKYVQKRFDLITNRSSDLIGGIAKHKFNILLNAKLLSKIILSLRMNYTGRRPTIVSNPISEIDPSFIVNLNIQLDKILFNKISLFCTIFNLFDSEYYHPGWDNAAAGEDLNRPSRSYYSSRLPQPYRNFLAGISLEF